MKFNPIMGQIDLDSDECAIIDCAMRKCDGFLRPKDHYMLHHCIWNQALRVDFVDAATKVLRLWNIEAQYAYATKMVNELEELVTHTAEWEENIRRMLEREKNGGNE